MTESDPLGATTQESARKLDVVALLDKYGILLVILILSVILYASQPDVFFTWRNLTNILTQNSVHAVLAIGMFMVILTAGIDLSVGSVLALAMMCLAVSSAHVPWPIALIMGPLVGAAAGFLNGVGITKLKMPHPFIMTLGMLFAARGLANIVSGGVPYSGLPDPVRFLGSARIPVGEWADRAQTLPFVVVFVLVLYVVFHILFEHTVFGRRLYSIGGNPQAAKVSGIDVDRHLIVVYTICGLMAGLAGLIMAGRTNSGFPNAGIGIELEAIAAVIIGGASFFGGRGTLIGVFGGVLVMGLINNGLNLNNVSVFYQQVLIGIIIVVAVSVDVFRREISRRK
jgi:ribose transport system permease protein